MISNWKKMKLEEVVDVLGDGLHGTPKYSKNGEYYFINGNNLKGKIVVDGKTKRVSSEEYMKYKKKLNNRTIFVSLNGTLGNVALYNEEKVVLGKSACYFNVMATVDKLFIMHIMRSEYFKNYAENYSTGTTIKNLGLRQMRNFSFNLPPLSEQNAIANILSSLDEKIETNNQINKTLEDMAQEIFKHWFVDFEFPNEDGKPYKSNGGEMVESELGMIPKGWEVKKISDVLDTIEAGNRPKGGAGNLISGVPSIGAENIIGLGKYDYSKEKFVTEEYFNNMKKGVVYSEDVLLYKDGAQLGRKSMFMDGFPHKKCCINSHVFIFRTNELISQEYLYFWFDQDVVTQSIINLNANSAQPGINQSQVKSLKIVVPNKDNIDAFKLLISPFLKKVFANCLENKKLSNLRDTLLPKLMSGEIRVPVDK